MCHIIHKQTTFQYILFAFLDTYIVKETLTALNIFLNYMKLCV